MRETNKRRAMNRREFLRRTGAASLAGVLGGALSSRPARAAEAKPPNVLLIISDDQAWTDFGFMGHPTIRTPSLDRLAAQSLVFSRGYVPTALCRPSLATLSTGLYPHQHRTVGNDPKGGRANTAWVKAMVDRFKQLPSVAGMLAKKGYVSHQSGKWWEGAPANGGFTAGMTHGDPKRRGRHGDVGLKIGRDGLAPIESFLDAHPGKPFFLWYAPFLPHTPHNPPERLLSKYTAPDRPAGIAKYWAMCEWFDETCGQLLAALEKRGLADNTLVVFVTDNGWIQPTNSGPRNFDALRGKRTAYEGGVRTPIMVRWPGKVRPQRDEKTLASSIDIVPTILKACGLEPTAEMPGLNLLDPAALAKREAIFGEAFAHDVEDINDPSASLRHRWCIEGNWKLLLPHAPNMPNAKVELFDVIADPHEKKDLAADQPEKVKHLTKLIDQWWPIEGG